MHAYDDAMEARRGTVRYITYHTRGPPRCMGFFRHTKLRLGRTPSRCREVHWPPPRLCASSVDSTTVRCGVLTTIPHPVAIASLRWRARGVPSSGSDRVPYRRGLSSSPAPHPEVRSGVPRSRASLNPRRSRRFSASRTWTQSSLRSLGGCSPSGTAPGSKRHAPQWSSKRSATTSTTPCAGCSSTTALCSLGCKSPTSCGFSTRST